MNEPLMLEDWDGEEPAPRKRVAFWPLWWWPVLLWLPLDGWHSRFARDLPRRLPAPDAHAWPSPEVLAWVATAAVLLAALAEAGFYGMLWAARGRRLPIAAATVAVVQTGVLELLALQVLDAARHGAGPWVAALAGSRAFAPDGAAVGAIAIAFGGAGLLALARCALWAEFQSALTGSRFREAFALTCAVWFASHLAQWWLIELWVGSALPGRGPSG